MPKSFLITNKRYKADGLCQKVDICSQQGGNVNPLDSLPDKLDLVTTDHTVPQTEQPAPSCRDDDSGSGKENELDEIHNRYPADLERPKVTYWSEVIPLKCAAHDCSTISDLSTSPARPSETPDSASSDISLEPVDYSLKGRQSPPYKGQPYFPNLFSTVIEERIRFSGPHSPLPLPSPYDMPNDLMYKTNLGELDYNLNALVEKAWGEINIGDTHVCPECGKRYSTSSNLARHRQTHRSVNDKKARKCPHCEKVYVSMPAYSMHVRTHNQGCECPYCNKRFSRPWLLQGHIRTHTGEKPFKCPQCGKAFADKSNLRAHVQTHSADKPYACDRCGKAFALKSYLYKHEESSCMRGQHTSSLHRPYHRNVGTGVHITDL